MTRLVVFLAVSVGLFACASGPAPMRQEVIEPQHIVAPTLDATDQRIAALQGELRVLDATKRLEIRAEKRAAQEMAEKPLRTMLSWAQWVGGALSVLGVLALGLTFSPWGAWIPGGRVTAACAVGTGTGVIFLARSIGTALDIAWLPLALLVAGVAAACAWIAWLSIRETAAHADRVAPAVGPAALTDAGRASAAAQSQRGVRWLINAVRPRPARYAPSDAPTVRITD